MYVYKRGEESVQELYVSLALSRLLILIKLVLDKLCPLFKSLSLVDGRKETVMFDKITSRISKLCYGLNPDFIEPAEITMKVIAGVYAGVTTTELDTLAAETAAAMTTKHPDYAILAARVAVSNLHKETKKLFTGKCHG